MKIAYIYYLYTDTSIGVLNKIHDQNKSITKAGLNDIDVIVLQTQKSGRDGNIQYIKIPDYKLNKLYALIYIFCKFFYLKRKVNIDKYDAIILRSAGFDTTYKNFIDKNNVFLEVHAFGHLEGKMKMSQQISKFKKIVKKIQIWQYNKYFFKNLNMLKGVITVSEDVHKYIKNTNTIPSLVVSNGIYFNDDPEYSFSLFDGKTLKILMVISRPDAWHGIDRLYTSALQYVKTNNYIIEINIIGDVKRSDISYYKKHENVIINLCGIVQPEHVSYYARKNNIAVAVLCLYRKNLENHSTIKVPEYIKLKIPFVLGYNEYALKHSNVDDQFYLRVPNSEEPLDFDKIISFAKNVSENREEVISQMKNYAKKYLEWSTILSQYVSFVHKALNK